MTVRIYVKNLKLFLLPYVLFSNIEVAGAIEITAHKAFYSIKLGNVSQGSNFVGVRGNMAVVLERTCEGWTMSQNLRMDLATPSGEEVLQDFRSTAWESDDGTIFRFFSSNNVNGKREDFRGQASKMSTNEEGIARYKMPKGLSFKLPKGTLFPIRHNVWLIEKALAGERQVSSKVFDGSSGGGGQKVSAFISKKKKSVKIMAKKFPKALRRFFQRSAWNIRMGFYELNSQNSAPIYEVEVLQLENGITPSLIVEYNDFSVILTMERLEVLPRLNC